MRLNHTLEQRWLKANLAHLYMSKVLSTLFNVGAVLVRRCIFNVNDLPTFLTVFQRWANVIMLYG